MLYICNTNHHFTANLLLKFAKLLKTVKLNGIIIYLYIWLAQCSFRMHPNTHLLCYLLMTAQNTWTVVNVNNFILQCKSLSVQTFYRVYQNQSYLWCGKHVIIITFRIPWWALTWWWLCDTDRVQVFLITFLVVCSALSTNSCNC